MVTIQDLLNRARWDKTFGAAHFEIGYYDRVADAIIRVPLDALIFTTDDHFSFSLLDEDGEVHNVPYHRVKQVFRDGELIWHREH